MRLEKTDIKYIAEMLKELHALQQDSTMGTDAWEYSKILLLLEDAMRSDDAIVIDTEVPFPVASYEHG